MTSLPALSTAVTRQDAAFELKRRRGARRSLLSFTTYTKQDYETNWHHQAVCDILDRFAQGEIKNLMVFMPPQTGKSELSSRRLPAYLLGQRPDAKIALCSYAAEHATAFNRDVQRIIDSPDYKQLFPETRLNASNVRTDAHGAYIRTQNIFEVLKYRGFFKTVGIGGPLTGTTVDIGIIDDPFKDRKEANSKIIRDSVDSWYTDVFKTRLHNASQQLLLMTRWHEDDLAGRLLKSEADKWEVVTFPAIKEDYSNPFDTREVGEVLWPNRHSLERMLEIKDKTPSTFNSLYQQNPTSPEGNMLKSEWFTTIDYNTFLAQAGPKPTINFFADTAYTEKQENDPTALMACCYHRNTLYILDSEAVRQELPDLVKHIPSYFAKHGGDGRSRLLIEPKASGLSTIQTLKRETRLSVIALPPTRDDKVTRVANVTPFLESNRCVLIAGGWTKQFLEECKSFPKGKHDDQVDNLTAAINYFTTQQSASGWV